MVANNSLGRANRDKINLSVGLFSVWHFSSSACEIEKKATSEPEMIAEIASKIRISTIVPTKKTRDVSLIPPRINAYWSKSQLGGSSIAVSNH